MKSGTFNQLNVALLEIRKEDFYQRYLNLYTLVHENCSTNGAAIKIAPLDEMTTTHLGVKYINGTGWSK